MATCHQGFMLSMPMPVLGEAVSSIIKKEKGRTLFKCAPHLKEDSSEFCLLYSDLLITLYTSIEVADYPSEVGSILVEFQVTITKHSYRTGSGCS